MSKGKLRSIVVNDIEWNYVVEHNMDRKAEVRIYDTKTKQIIKRVGFNQLGFNDYEIEHGNCTITPFMIKEYIQKELNLKQ